MFIPERFKATKDKNLKKTLRNQLVLTNNCKFKIHSTNADANQGIGLRE